MQTSYINSHFDALKQHEMIHLYQARSTRDSWMCFYWKYFRFWLQGCRYRKKLPNAGYRLNPFEMEAYMHMYDKDYLKSGGKAEGWKKYAAMTPAQRLEEYIRVYRHR